MVLAAGMAHLSPVADGPADARPVGFSPPAVEHRKVETAVGYHLHAARTRSLEGPPRVVEPHIDALDEHGRLVQVVVLKEHHAVAQAFALDDVQHLADELLASAVTGMGLARHQELHRPLVVLQDGLEPGDVTEQQGGALVGGETAGEADGERVRTKRRAGPPRRSGRGGDGFGRPRPAPLRGRRLPAARGAGHASATTPGRGCGPPAATASRSEVSSCQRGPRW